MRKSQILQLKLAGYSADSIYRYGAGELGLFGIAFFGHRGTKNENRQLKRLWNRVLEVFGVS